MKRRTFVKKSLLTSGGVFMLNGVAVQTLQGMDRLRQSAESSTNNRILVLIQMHGGNDGLNTLIPINQYSAYYNLRPNIAISETGQRKYQVLDNTLSTDKQLGLHPDMKGFKELYDAGYLAIVQNVGYENMNGSHFKGRDIWFGGVGASDPITSGWMGRYLQLEYEKNGLVYPTSFPNTDMPYPLGLEFSNEVSLGFNTEKTVPAAISIPNPGTFFDLVSELTGYNDEIKVDPRGFPPEAMKSTLYASELEWILGIENGTDQYADKLQKAYKLGNAQPAKTVYPERYPLAAPSGSLYNGLGNNLQIISKLISGGCTTKIYLVRIGGFDTHVRQVESYDNSYGAHAALMYHVSASMKAFQDDLRERGVADKVLTVTMSEFGRRAASNNSYGSDHGTVAPLFVMGTSLNPGVIGSNANLQKVAENGGNLSDKKDDIIDFRILFSTILQDWFELPNEQIPTVFPTLRAEASTSWGEADVYDKLPLFSKLTSLNEYAQKPIYFELQPNPASVMASVQVEVPKILETVITLTDLRGHVVQTLFNGYLPAGKHTFPILTEVLPDGIYLVTFRSAVLTLTKKLRIQK